MRRDSSRSFRGSIFLTMALLFAASLTAYGQSLGDVARENREKKAADASSTPPKVITNATLPKDPDAGAGPSTDESKMQTAPSPASAESSRKAAQQRAAEQRAAQRWKKLILTQENTIANLQTRIDKLKASIQFVDQNGAYDYYGAVANNRYQARQLQRLREMQQQLGQQKNKLEDMQEAARHAGMHTTTYDP